MTMDGLMVFAVLVLVAAALSGAWLPRWWLALLTHSVTARPAQRPAAHHGESHHRRAVRGRGECVRFVGFAPHAGVSTCCCRRWLLQDHIARTTDADANFNAISAARDKISNLMRPIKATLVTFAGARPIADIPCIMPRVTRTVAHAPPQTRSSWTAARSQRCGRPTRCTSSWTQRRL